MTGILDMRATCVGRTGPPTALWDPARPPKSRPPPPPEPRRTGATARASASTSAPRAAPPAPRAAPSREQQPGRQQSRRSLILSAPGLAILAPLLPPAAPPAAAAPGGRLPTPAEQAAIESALSAALPRGRSPAALRILFHDAGTFRTADGRGGLNGSVRFELGRPENAGLKKIVRTLDDALGRLEGTAAAGKVSFADMVALGAAFAVRVCGGPAIPVRIGRRDAAAADPEGRLPAETLSAAELKGVFAAQGFDTRELVLLSGSHTIGGKGFGGPTDFDNAYFRVLLDKPWLRPG